MEPIGQPVDTDEPQRRGMKNSRRFEPSLQTVVEQLQQARLALEAATHGGGATASLLHTVVNQYLSGGQQFWLVLMADDGVPRVESFRQVEQLLSRIREYIDKDVAVFPFIGHYMPVTKGPYRYLRAPNRQLLPIFSIPTADDIEDEEHGWLGSGTPIVPDPTAPEVTAETPAEDHPEQCDGDMPLWDDSDAPPA